MIYPVGMRIGQFDRYDMCTETVWSISDMSYDTLHAIVLLKQVYMYAFQGPVSLRLKMS